MDCHSTRKKKNLRRCPFILFGCTDVSLLTSLLYLNKSKLQRMVSPWSEQVPSVESCLTVSPLPFLLPSLLSSVKFIPSFLNYIVSPTYSPAFSFPFSHDSLCSTQSTESRNKLPSTNLHLTRQFSLNHIFPQTMASPSELLTCTVAPHSLVLAFIFSPLIQSLMMLAVFYWYSGIFSIKWSMSDAFLMYQLNK